MWKENYIPTLTECRERAESEGIAGERGEQFWQHNTQYRWRSQFPIEDNWRRFMQNTPTHMRKSEPPEAGTKLIPPEEWYAEMKREEARRLAEYEAIHGKAIPMPMHMRKKTPRPPKAHPTS